jgi:hypothetical protein
LAYVTVIGGVAPGVAAEVGTENPVTEAQIRLTLCCVRCDVSTLPSLDGQRALAAEMFSDRGSGLIAEWLSVQFERIDDVDFAREFAEHVALPGVVVGDYNHRDVRCSKGRVLGGIRFYGRDVDRPFVDVFGHAFDDLADLCDCVKSEWSAFAPRYLRLHGLPGRLGGPGVLRDTTIHAARYRDMPAPDGRVTLEPFDLVDDAIAIVGRRYESLATQDPALAGNLSPAAADDLWEWHAAERLRAIRVADTTVGVLAVVPGGIAWLAGDEIQEEAIDVGHTGHGYATAAQLAWQKDVTVDPDRFLIGTIDRHNGASRITAERAGRREVMEAVFLPL